MNFKAIWFAIEKVVLPKLGESIVSKVGEKTADKALNAANNITDNKGIIRSLENNLKLLSAMASDIEEQINNAELSGKKKPKQAVVEWLRQVKSLDTEWGTHTQQEGFIGRLKDGGTAAQLNHQVRKLLEQSGNFGEPLLDVCGTGTVIFSRTKMVGKAFQANLENIWRLMETREVSCIAVYGMGGMGKTKLATDIHNRLVDQCEGRVFWVTVSQNSTIRSLQDKIAHCVGVQVLLDKDETKIRAGKLRHAFSKMKNSVLILDDVWDDINLTKLGCLVSKECCRLIITTRSKKVIKRMNCEGKEIIAVQKLDEDEAWELFSETLGEEIKLSPQVEDIAKSVAELCDGLPLAIITVAGSMRGEEAMQKWSDTYGKLKECKVGRHKVFKVLKYSFDRLNKHDESGFNLIQLCFLYCSLYPEDCRIPREDLVGNLITEGLVKRRKSRREEVNQGRDIVDELVNVCLLESCVGLSGSKYVKMHDLVRGMALKITKGKYMVRAGDKSMMEIPMEQEWTENLEKVSLMCSNIRIIEEETSPNCPNLSTLLLHYNTYLEFIDDSFFCRMQGIRTLDLSHTGIWWLPNSIFELKSLEALLLEWCEKLEHVPNLGKLKALRELNLDGTPIKEVPQGVEELLNLKVLSLAFTEVDVVPRGLLLKLVGLQILRLPCHVQVAIEEIQNRKLLEEFRGGLKSIGEFNSFITCREHDHTIYRIKVEWQGEVEHDSEGEVEHVSKGEVELDFRNCDKAVILTECSLENENLLGQGIECLVMKICEGLSKCLLDDLSRWNNFTSLKILAIESCGGIEFILRSEQAELATSLFSTLEEIELRDLEDLKGLIETGGASTAQLLVTFPSLTCLLADKCMKMRRLGLPLSEFPKLQSLHIWECGEIEEIFKDELGRRGRTIEEIGGPSAALPQPLFSSSLRRLDIHECNKVRKLGISVLEVPNLEYIDITNCSELEEIFEDHHGTGSGVALPKLLELSLEGLPRLKSLCKAPIICNSIQRIKILKCPGLTKKLPLHFDAPPPSLKVIAVEREWWNSLDWDNLNLPALLQSFLTFKD